MDSGVFASNSGTAAEKAVLRRELGEFGIVPSDHQLAQLSELGARLYEKNATLNLTRIPEGEFIEKHILDSLAVVMAVPIEGAIRLIDVGTGAGFPALPLAICFPTLEVTALDATRKKLDFVSDVARGIGLPNLTVVHGRAEEIQCQLSHAQGYQIAVARAVAPLARLAPWLLPFVAPGGVAVALKGSSIADEMKEYRISVSKGSQKRYLKNGWPEPEVMTLSPSRTVVTWRVSGDRN
jgi:16S rRNA (guanine527-N7)-methyltransferase